MRPNAWFQCIRGCPERHPLSAILYRCPRCDALLEVAHDLAALRELADPAGWRARIAGRRGGAWPLQSGVWSAHELVQPHVAEEHIVSLGEGNSALLPAARHAASIGLSELYVKQCGTSHTGSFKDLGMTVLVSSVQQMIADGAPIRAVVCASTGDTSAALAAYGAAAGIPVIVLLPAGKISAAQLLQPLAHGALVCSLATDFDGCMRVVQRLSEDPTLYLANSMNSLRVEGQKTIAVEILQQLGWELPEWVLVPGGNLGNVSAIAKGFVELRALGLIDRLPRLVCCQAHRANPLYRAFARARAAGHPLREEDYQAVVAGPTQASAIRIGAPVSLPKAIRALHECDGLVEEASEEELADAAARGDRHGLFCCPHTGVALACLEKLIARGVILRDERVVVISTAHGLKFSEFKAAYHEGRAEFPSHHQNRPVMLGAEPEAVVGAIHRLLDEAAT
ncbi:MAG: threonine synthase [Myxococcales bacterium]|nr:threonine synthase [Myxococcales bacterium]